MTFRMSITSLDMEFAAGGVVTSLDGSSAILGGPNNRYRYELRRTWDLRKPALVVCMLNLSTADHQKNDPTILTLIHFARLWGFGGLIVVNLNAFRSSSPAEMFAASDPVGPDNDNHIKNALRYAREIGRNVLVAWGNDGAFMDREARFVAMANEHRVGLMCLGTTLCGAPKHPLARGRHRIPRDQKPIVWRAA